MLSILFQSAAYATAFFIPYLMLTGSLKPHFYYPLYSIPILSLSYFSGPMGAAGMLILSIAVGIGGFIFSLGDLKGGVPFIFLLQTAWLYFLFWISGRLLEVRDLKIHRLHEEVEKLEIEIAGLHTKRKALEESCHGFKERMARYTQLRSFTDSLALSLRKEEVQSQAQNLIQRLFNGQSQIEVQLNLFSSGSQSARNSIEEWVAKHKIPLLVSDIHTDSRFYRHPAFKSGSLMSAPLEIGSSVEGALIVHTQTLNKWEDEDVRFLADIANIISLAVTNALYYEKAESLAVRDSLTGLFVRYRFDERIEEEFFRAKENNLPLSLIIFDIDHFKNVNDRWGHPVGDEALKSVSQMIMNQTRETDFCARYGGEEIAVLMPLTKTENALQIAERIRQKIVSQAIGKQKISVTISGGIASISPSINKVQDFIQAADLALYRAKEKGRDRVTL